MYIPVLIIASILSFFPISEKIFLFLVQKKKYISWLIYILCFLSFIYLSESQMIGQTWETSLDLLWFILWLPILSKVFELKIPAGMMIYRKELGILMGTMAFVHSLQYMIPEYQSMWADAWMPWKYDFWFLDGQLTFLGWWMLALIIAIILTVTSNNYSLKLFGWKIWKYIHRSVYALLIFTLLHVAALDVGPDIFALETLVIFIPFLIYFFFKVLQWRGVKINLVQIVFPGL